MVFHKTTAYSLNVLSFMSGDPERTMSASYINRELGIPYSYLRLVMGNLSKKGFIVSIKGRDGGFRLADSINNIYLSEIIDASEGLDDFRKCIMGFSVCPFNNGCSMHPLWVEMRTTLLSVLEKTSLADLLRNRKPNQSK